MMEWFLTLLSGSFNIYGISRGIIFILVVSDLYVVFIIINIIWDSISLCSLSWPHTHSSPPSLAYKSAKMMCETLCPTYVVFYLAYLNKISILWIIPKNLLLVLVIPSIDLEIMISSIYSVVIFLSFIKHYLVSISLIFGSEC